jgi:hypothetical protein
MGHIFLFWATDGTKRGANKYKEIIYTQEQIMKMCAGVIWLRIETIDESVCAR